MLGDRAATRQWFTIVRRGAFGGDDTRFIRGSIGGVERWEEFSFVRLPRRRVERYPKTRRRFRASSHRDRVACVNDSTAISSFHCLSARSRATRGRSRRWGRETTPHREGEKITRSRAGTGNRAGIERATGVARRTPAPRPPLCVDRVRLPINIRSSSRVNRFESSHRGVAVESTNSPRVPLNSFSSPSPLDARALAVCRLFSRAFRSSRSFVPSASPSVVFPVPRVVLPPLPPPRFPPRLASVSSPGRARCRDIGIFIRSFGWTRCSVLRVMTRECTRAQTTTSYDSRYMECTPGYIRWRSSRRLESRRRRRTDDARDRGRDDETFPSPGDGDDRTTSPSVRVIQPSSRVCLDSFFSFRALANRMNDRPTIRGENAVPPLASRSSIVRVVRVVRVVPTSTSTPTSARAVARTAPNATRRRAPARIVHSNRPESSRPPPFRLSFSACFFFLFTSV